MVNTITTRHYSLRALSLLLAYQQSIYSAYCGVNALLLLPTHHHHRHHHGHHYFPSTSIISSSLFAADDRQHHHDRHRRISSSTSTEKSSTATTTAAERLVQEEEQARQSRIGQAKRRFEKSVRREDRISILESQSSTTLSIAEQAELEGLRQSRDNFEEQYDPESFSEEHARFKLQHNRAFSALSRYCQERRKMPKEDVRVFFLDGPDGGTATHLMEPSEEGGGDHGDGYTSSYALHPSQCYVANRHESTCDALRVSGGGMLPNENVLHATAAEALSPGAGNGNDSFADIDFCAYYFDGCGGFVPHVIGMMTAALVRGNDNNNNNNNNKNNENDCSQSRPKTTAVGFSLMGGNRNVIEKELEVCRALSLIAKSRGMTTRHVLDDPERYGIPVDVAKTLGGTFTTWILLEAE